MNNIWSFGEKGCFHGIGRLELNTVIEIPDKSLWLNTSDKASDNHSDTLTEWLFSLSDTSDEPSENLPKINVYLANGNVSISDINIGNIDAEVSNGSISLSNIDNVYGNLKTTISNGYFKADKTRCHTLDIESSNGKVNVSNTGARNAINVNTANGSIEVKNIVSNHISLESANGSIEVKNIVSNNISLESANGYISGNIIGKPSDYNTTSSTSLGNNSLEVYNSQITNSVKKLNVVTSNGDISVKFTDKDL